MLVFSQGGMFISRARELRMLFLPSPSLSSGLRYLNYSSTGTYPWAFYISGMSAKTSSYRLITRVQYLLLITLHILLLFHCFFLFLALRLLPAAETILTTLSTYNFRYLTWNFINDGPWGSLAFYQLVQHAG